MPKQMPGGRGDRIGPADKAPLQNVFDFDAFVQWMKDMRGGHKFPIDSILPYVAGAPAPGPGSAVAGLAGAMRGMRGAAGAAEAAPVGMATEEGALAAREALMKGYDDLLKQLSTRYQAPGTQMKFPGM